MQQQSTMTTLPFTPYAKIDFDPVDKGPLLIVGNGRSLVNTPLDEITIPSWGMNLIARLWEKISPDVTWRPDRWWWGDYPQRTWHVDAMLDYIRTYPGEKWVREDAYEILIGYSKAFAVTPHYHKYEYLKLPHKTYPGETEDVVPWKRCIEHTAAGWKSNRTPDYYPHFPEDGSLCKPGTTVAIAILQAIKEGYDPIYLAGCDVGFTADEPTHFDPDYYDTAVISPASAIWTNQLIEWQHSCIDQWAKENGRSILNAGIGGELKAHERVDFSVLT